MSELQNRDLWVHCNKFGDIIEIAMHNRLVASDNNLLVNVKTPYAISLITGKLKVTDYIIKFTDDEPELIKKITNIPEMLCQWICNIDSKCSGLFAEYLSDNYWNIQSKTKNIKDYKLWITLKNDPNSLIDTIKLNQSNIKNDNTWSIEVDRKLYDIMVLTDAA